MHCAQQQVSTPLQSSTSVMLQILTLNLEFRQPQVKGREREGIEVMADKMAHDRSIPFSGVAGRTAAGGGQLLRERGFSLLELLIVVVIAIVVAAIAVPAVRRTITTYQLDSSSRAVANMLQQVRISAEKNETPYYAQFNGVAGPSIVFAVPAARWNPNLNYIPNIDPTTATTANITFPAAAPPAHGQLETAMGVPVGNAAIGGPIGFNSRGLPCQQRAGSTAWICDPTTQGFEWFMQNGMTGAWAAITVSPAGRIKSWRMTSNGVWQ